MKIPKTGIVVVTYDSESVIKGCLKSIFANTYPNMEVVVVDNASTDKTVQTVRKYFKKAHIITNKTNVGFGAANNIGIKYLLKRNSKYILLLNPDTVSSQQLIQELLNPFSKDINIGIVGCIITYSKSVKKIWFAGGYFNRLFCFARHKYMNKYLSNVEIKSGNVDFITGACMMIKTEIIRKTGLIPEQYFLYFEDVFFCQKVKDAGFNCLLLSKPLISHQVSTSTGIKATNKMTPLRAYYFARNPILYIRNEVNGYLKITNLIGQFFIRLPIYTFRMAKDRNIKSIYYYYKGIVDSIFNGSSNFFLNSS